MKTIEDYIYVEKHIPAEICEELIDECNQKEWQKHRWNNNLSEKTKELDVMNCTKEQLPKIIPHLLKALREYQVRYSWPGEKTQPPWITKFSSIRFNKYEVGNTMRLHYDNIHTVFDGKLKGIPILSIIGNLNEDYEGAEFMIRDKEIKLKTGDILLFPSGIIYPHMVKETTKGVRYSFVSWAF